jgi:hypothetical protein
MAIIESLFFPFRGEWRKFAEIIGGLEWKQKGECNLISQHNFAIGVFGESAVEIQRGDEE